jgi:SanA protein
MNGHFEFRSFIVILLFFSENINDFFMKPNISTILKFLIFLLGIIFLLLLLLRITFFLFASQKIYQLENVPNSRAAIVFGAGLRIDGSATQVLRDRVKTAVDLYKTGKVEKILLSGDNRFINYNEPAAMAAYARDLEVPEIDLVLDYAGQSTYDSCYRAKAIFRLNQAILVTQSFHLPRALFICNQLGIESIGVSADQHKHWSISFVYWQIRELPASLAAIFDVWIFKPIPILGDPEPIFKDNN